MQESNTPNLGFCHRGHPYTAIQKNGWRRCLTCTNIRNRVNAHMRKQMGMPVWRAEGRSYAAYVRRCRKQIMHAQLTGYGKKAQMRYREKLRQLYGGCDLRVLSTRMRFLLKGVDIK